MVFEYPSNFSNGTVVIDPGTFAQYADYVSGGAMGYAMLVVIFFVSFGGALASGTKKALLFASFVSFVFSTLMFRLDLVPIYVPIFLIILGMVGAAGSKAEGRM